MRTVLRPTILTLLAAATIAALPAPWPGEYEAAAGDRLLRRHRLRKLSDEDSMQGPPFGLDFSAPDCNPLFPGIPEVLGDAFDPGAFDEISVAGRGRILVYASNAIAGDLPSPTKDLVVFVEGGGRERVGEAAGDDDQPSVRFDRFGWRLAFRGSEGVAGESDSDVFLRSVTRAGDDAGTETVNVTGGVGSSFDPSLTARTRSRGVGGGISVRERDARLAFVATGNRRRDGRPVGDDDVGLNPDGSPELFLWRERRQPHFLQLTSISDPLAEVNRPSISAAGSAIAFECTADLTPNAVSPLDPDRVGNPDGVRQIYVWRARRGVHQITWSDEDCFAPRMSLNGRFVFFCTRGDLLVGANPEGNYEVFRWRRGARRARRLAQLTQTAEGDNVLPRPLSDSRGFVFYSTAQPPVGGLAFGEGPAQCGPSAFLYLRRRVRRVFGVTDAENIALGTAIATGPPAPGGSAAKIQFTTNDPQFDGVGDEAGPLKFHLVRATRFPRD